MLRGKTFGLESTHNDHNNWWWPWVWDVKSCSQLVIAFWNQHIKYVWYLNQKYKGGKKLLNRPGKGMSLSKDIFLNKSFAETTEWPETCPCFYLSCKNPSINSPEQNKCLFLYFKLFSVCIVLNQLINSSLWPSCQYMYIVKWTF